MVRLSQRHACWSRRRLRVCTPFLHGSLRTCTNCKIEPSCTIRARATSSMDRRTQETLAMHLQHKRATSVDGAWKRRVCSSCFSDESVRRRGGRTNTISMERHRRTCIPIPSATRDDDVHESRVRHALYACDWTRSHAPATNGREVIGRSSDLARGGTHACMERTCRRVRCPPCRDEPSCVPVVPSFISTTRRNSCSVSCGIRTVRRTSQPSSWVGGRARDPLAPHVVRFLLRCMRIFRDASTAEVRGGGWSVPRVRGSLLPPSNATASVCTSCWPSFPALPRTDATREARHDRQAATSHPHIASCDVVEPVQPPSPPGSIFSPSSSTRARSGSSPSGVSIGSIGSSIGSVGRTRKERSTWETKACPRPSGAVDVDEHESGDAHRRRCWNATQGRAGEEEGGQEQSHGTRRTVRRKNELERDRIRHQVQGNVRTRIQQKNRVRRVPARRGHEERAGGRREEKKDRKSDQGAHKHRSRRAWPEDESRTSWTCLDRGAGSCTARHWSTVLLEGRHLLPTLLVLGIHRFG